MHFPDPHGIVGISIHALHEESDQSRNVLGDLLVEFQSTLSMRRATGRVHPIRLGAGISIHALHEESDQSDTKN